MRKVLYVLTWSLSMILFGYVIKHLGGGVLLEESHQQGNRLWEFITLPPPTSPPVSAFCVNENVTSQLSAPVAEACFPCHDGLYLSGTIAWNKLFLPHMDLDHGAFSTAANRSNMALRGFRYGEGYNLMCVHNEKANQDQSRRKGISLLGRSSIVAQGQLQLTLFWNVSCQLLLWNVNSCFIPSPVNDRCLKTYGTLSPG